MPDAPAVDAAPATMRASVLYAARSMRVERRPVPTPNDDEVLVRVAAVGVCGSDLHYFRDGRNGDRVVRSPLVLGHEASGHIAAVGRRVDPGRVGERVSVEPQRPCRTCRQCTAGRYNLCSDMRFFGSPPVDGAFAEYATIPADHAHAVPDALSDDAASLLEPLSVGVAAARKAGITVGSRVLIAGAGPIGLILAQVALAYGAAEVLVSDPVAERRAYALRMGATGVFDPALPRDGRLEVDAFVDASGAAAAVVAGIRDTGAAGTVVLVGLGVTDMSLPVTDIMNRELTVTGIYRYAGTWPAALHLAASGKVDLDALVTRHVGLDEVPLALGADDAPGQLKTIVVPA